MALFKILKGQEKNLPTNKTEGWAYVTTDEGNMYVDVSTSKRVKIGSHADTASRLNISSTDNAIARFNGTDGTIQNSRAIIDDTGNVIFNNSNGGDITLTLKRGGNTYWIHKVSGGNYSLWDNSDQMLLWHENSQGKDLNIYAPVNIGTSSANRKTTLYGNLEGTGQAYFSYSGGYASGNTYTLRLGANNNNHLDLGYDGLQAKNASNAVSALYLNYNGGNVNIGKNGTQSSLITNVYGRMSITNITSSTYSKYSGASIVTAGGASIGQQLSAKSIRIDDNYSNAGCTVHFNKTQNCIEFVFD